MVGNDIVDFDETRRSSNWERRGFLQKIFTTNEQLIIDMSSDPNATVWHLWSMKESAYKVFIQAGGNRFFDPTKIECLIDSSQKGRAKINTTTFWTKTSINSKYVFSTALLNNIDIDTRIFRLNQKSSKYQSDFMHQQVIQDFAERNSLNSSEISVHKNKKGVPIIYYKNKSQNKSLSITHHGNYGAYSILKN
jgi:phosphopantetheinyl transferase (holo-ACP synthase)